MIIGLPLSAFADLLERFGIPRAFGAVSGLLLGLGAIARPGRVDVPAFTHEINQFVASLPTIVDDLRHRLAGLTGTSPSHVGKQIQHFVNGYTQHPAKLLGPAASIGASVAGGIAALVVVLLTAVYTAIHPIRSRTASCGWFHRQGAPRRSTSCAACAWRTSGG